jgi:uncharacterized protein YndB with AHSA1/START domain
MPGNDLTLTQPPTMRTGLLIRKPPRDVFQAIADPAVTTKIWYTKSSGKMTPGADLLWEWEMYGASSKVSVKEIEDNSRILFTWSGYTPDKPTTVEFRFVPWKDDTTYVQITETGFSGDGDTVAKYATDSTQGFTFLLSALKALLEHDVILKVTLDAHPAGLEV